MFITLCRIWTNGRYLNVVVAKNRTGIRFEMYVVLHCLLLAYKQVNMFVKVLEETFSNRLWIFL